MSLSVVRHPRRPLALGGSDVRHPKESVDRIAVGTAGIPVGHLDVDAAAPAQRHDAAREDGRGALAGDRSNSLDCTSRVTSAVALEFQGVVQLSSGGSSSDVTKAEPYLTVDVVVGTAWDVDRLVGLIEVGSPVYESVFGAGVRDRSALPVLLIAQGSSAPVEPCGGIIVSPEALHATRHHCWW